MTDAACRVQPDFAVCVIARLLFGKRLFFHWKTVTDRRIWQRVRTYHYPFSLGRLWPVGFSIVRRVRRVRIRVGGMSTSRGSRLPPPPNINKLKTILRYCSACDGSATGDKSRVETARPRATATRWKMYTTCRNTASWWSRDHSNYPVWPCFKIFY